MSTYCTVANGYPVNWNEISRKLRIERGNICEWCGLPNGKHIRREDSRVIDVDLREVEIIAQQSKRNNINYLKLLKVYGITKIILTVAHLNHTPSDCREENLKVLCQKCHLSYDKKDLKKRKEPKQILKLFHD